MAWVVRSGTHPRVQIRVSAVHSSLRHTVAWSFPGEPSRLCWITQTNAVLIQPVDGLRNPAAVPRVIRQLWRGERVGDTRGSQQRVKIYNVLLKRLIT